MSSACKQQSISLQSVSVLILLTRDAVLQRRRGAVALRRPPAAQAPGGAAAAQPGSPRRRTGTAGRAGQVRAGAQQEGHRIRRQAWSRSPISRRHGMTGKARPQTGVGTGVVRGRGRVGHQRERERGPWLNRPGLFLSRAL